VGKFASRDATYPWGMKIGRNFGDSMKIIIRKVKVASNMPNTK
jgi:hypothetical protein